VHRHARLVQAAAQLLPLFVVVLQVRRRGDEGGWHVEVGDEGGWHVEVGDEGGWHVEVGDEVSLPSPLDE
jgi:hypothetical protein